MQVNWQKYLRGVYPLLYLALGVAAAQLFAAILGAYLTPDRTAKPAIAEQASIARRQAPLTDYDVILKRNIFDSSATETAELEPLPEEQQAETGSPTPTKAAARADLKLFGTVEGGPNPLAVIQVGQEMGVYHVGEEIPEVGRLHEVERKLVYIKTPANALITLPIYEGDLPARRPSRPATAARGGEGGYEIEEIGENRWLIPKEEADRARGNLNELLKTARMVPKVVNGQTEGFLVVSIRPRSFISMLGLQKGDVLMEVNGLELNSPEKALQIFQQLREARNITLGLERGGKRMTFEYEVN